MAGTAWSSRVRTFSPLSRRYGITLKRISCARRGAVRNARRTASAAVQRSNRVIGTSREIPPATATGRWGRFRAPDYSNVRPPADASCAARPPRRMRPGCRPRLPGLPRAGILPARRMSGRPFVSMSPSWTRRRPLTPPDSGAPVARLAVALAALLLVAASAPACGRSKNENRIKPIVATLTIQNPYQGAPDPAVYLFKDPKDSRFPDLETVEVRLRATSPVSFDAFTLEFTYNFLVIQVGDVFDVNPAVLGDCNGGSSC